MNLLKTSVLRNFIIQSESKLVYTTIIYKAFTIFNYSLFFHLKLQTIAILHYNFYLLNVNFYFLFIDYIYLFNYIRNLTRANSYFVSLPIRVKSYSVLRSPFVFSKSREHFGIAYHKLFFNISPWSPSEICYLFIESILSKITLHSSKFWYKRELYF